MLTDSKMELVIGFSANTFVSGYFQRPVELNFEFLGCFGLVVFIATYAYFVSGVLCELSKSNIKHSL